MLLRLPTSLLALVACAHAATIRVPSDQPTIQAGIDAAAEGDRILVAPGTYTGDGNRDIDFGGTNLLLVSEEGADSTVIDCEGAGRGLYFHSGESTATMVRGFTIRNGHSDTHPGGAGMLIHEASPTFALNILSGNTTGPGLNGAAARFIASSSLVSHCQVLGNHSGNWAGGFHVTESPGMVIQSTIVADNTASSGAGLVFDDGSDALLINCVVYGNVAGQEGSGLSATESAPTVLNSIVYANGSDDIYGTTFHISYSDIGEEWPGEGNINAAPLFVDPDNGDFHLQHSFSPCIDAGDTTTIDACLPPGLGSILADMGAYGGEENCGWDGCDSPALNRIYEPDTLYVADIANGIWALEACPELGFDFSAETTCGWLAIEPAVGFVPADSTVELTLIFDASELVPEFYSCPVTISYGNSGSIEAEVSINVLSPLEVEITDAPGQVGQGRKLRWEFTITNVTDQDRTADAWFDAYLRNGSPLPSNPARGPFTGTLGPGEVADFLGVVSIPRNAPLGGPYSICTVLGDDLDEWVSDCFDFSIQP